MVLNPMTLKTSYADLIFKYIGWAYQAELMRRDTDNPFNVLESDPTQSIHAYRGWGVNQQLSYLLNQGYEIASRYTYLKPHRDLLTVESQTEVMELGLTKYFKAHRLKFQANASYLLRDGVVNNSNRKGTWGGTFQVELGI